MPIVWPVRVLVVDAHPPHRSANADVVEALLALSGADVRRVNGSSETGNGRDRRPVLRCIHPTGWQVADVLPSVAVAEAEKASWQGTPLVVAADGPVETAATPLVSVEDRPVLWINGLGARAELDDTWSDHDHHDQQNSGQALLAVGAVSAGDGELEVADPVAYATLPRIGRRSSDALRDVIGRLSQGFRRWGVHVREVPSVAPQLHAYSIVELLELPVALCHSTLRSFLAEADGRRIAAPLLREGLTLAKRRRRQLGRLPSYDPQALVAAAQGRQRPSDGVEMHAPDRAFNRLLQAWQRGEAHPGNANEVLLRNASRMGTNPVANARVAQLARRVRTAGYFSSTTELLAALN